MPDAITSHTPIYEYSNLANLPDNKQKHCITKEETECEELCLRISSPLVYMHLAISMTLFFCQLLLWYEIPDTSLASKTVYLSAPWETMNCPSTSFTIAIIDLNCHECLVEIYYYSKCRIFLVSNRLLPLDEKTMSEILET